MFCQNPIFIRHNNNLQKYGDSIMQEKSKEKLAKYLRSIARYVLLVLGILVFIFALLSGGCSKDENPTEAKNDLALVGYWELTKMSSEYQGVTDTLTESQIDSMGLVWTLKIVTMSGTWSTSANQLTMTLTGPTGETVTLVYEYAIDGNILKLNWEIPAGPKFYAELTKQ
jgi:hypothetical protein